MWQAEDKEDLYFAREGARSVPPRYVELLNFRRLNVGAKLWGAVADVQAHGLLISLPQGLRGYVPAAEVCRHVW